MSLHSQLWPEHAFSVLHWCAALGASPLHFWFLKVSFGKVQDLPQPMLQHKVMSNTVNFFVELHFNIMLSRKSVEKCGTISLTLPSSIPSFGQWNMFKAVYNYKLKMGKNLFKLMLTTNKQYKFVLLKCTSIVSVWYNFF